MESKKLFDGWSERTFPTSDDPVIAPEWVDRRLMKIGQKFAQNHISAVNFCDILSLFFVMANREVLKTLISTGSSGCVFSSYRRYLSTQKRVNTWYTDDILDHRSEARINLAKVGRMHKLISRRMETATAAELAERTTVKKPLSRLVDIVRADLKKAGVGEISKFAKGDNESAVYLSQWQMAYTQFGFLGLVVMFPKKLGIVDATEEDLEGLVHLWAVVGHYLGIKDEHNWCLEGLDSLQKRGHSLIQSLILPSIKNADADWEHMSRVLIQGVHLYMPTATYEQTLLHFFWVLEVPMPGLWKAVSWHHKLLFYFNMFMLTIAIYLPGMRSVFNWLYKTSVGMSEKQSPKSLEAVKQKATLYEEHFHLTNAKTLSKN